MHEKELRFAMKIGGDYRVSPWHNAWPRAARELRLDPAAAGARITHLMARAPDAMADAAGTEAVKALARPVTGRLVDLVADRVVRCRRLLERG